MLVGVLEALALVYLAFTGDVEFAVMALYFVVIATIVAMPATGLLIFAWLSLVRGVPTLDRHRAWLAPFTLLFAWPLFFAPISLYEFAVAAPTLLGFVVPRVAVRELASGLVVKKDESEGT